MYWIGPRSCGRFSSKASSLLRLSLEDLILLVEGDLFSNKSYMRSSGSLKQIEKPVKCFCEVGVRG